MSKHVPIPLPKHPAWISQILVLKALLRREALSRYGRYRLGFFWMLFEPLIHTIIIGVIVGTITDRRVNNIPYAFFLLNGVMQLQLFKSSWSSGLNAITSNQGLLVYPTVKPLDPFIARFFFQIRSMVVSSALFYAVGLWVGVKMSLENLHIVYLSYFLTWLCGCGFGLLFGVANFHFSEIQKTVAILQRPLLFVSCVLYPSASVPGPVRDYLLWNPLLHTIELSRKALFPAYYVPEAGLGYPAAFAIVAVGFGLAVFHNNRNLMTQRSS
jgi:capsular polysaccharide transport system permease protein